MNPKRRFANLYTRSKSTARQHALDLIEAIGEDEFDVDLRAEEPSFRRLAADGKFRTLKAYHDGNTKGRFVVPAKEVSPETRADLLRDAKLTNVVYDPEGGDGDILLVV